MVAGEASPAARRAERLGSARLLIAREEPEAALRLLDGLRDSAPTPRAGVEALVLAALALQAHGETERATSALAEALALAEPEGYVRTFTDEGAPMASLLSAALEPRRRGLSEPPVPPRYARKILAALDWGAPSPSAELPDPLSGRELEVLRLVAAGESNRRIASELYVSEATVKTHINNLYRKLGTHSRTQAVARARELGIIP